MSELLESLVIENKRLSEHNKILSEQVSIAKEGLEALDSIGNIAGIPQKTLQVMKDCEQESLKKKSEKE